MSKLQHILIRRGRDIAFGAMTLLIVTGACAEELKIGGTGAALGSMRLLAEAYARTAPQTKVTVLPSMGSAGGIKAVLAGAIPLAVSSRPLKEAELAGGAVETEYGRTPFVFATAQTNPATGFTSAQLADIFAGKTERWPDGTPIRLVLRPVGDADSEMIKSMSPEMRAAKTLAEQRKGMAFAVTDQDAANTIEKVPGALGVSTLALILSEKRQIKALSLNQVAPDAEAIADGRYPLVRILYFVTGAKPSADAQAFMAFARSPAGRTILQQAGHWVK